jgi:hypothetical protein
MSDYWGSSSKQPRRSEKIKLADGRLFVHGFQICVRSCVIEFWYRRTWRCRFAIDADGAQGLVSSWQRMVHEPSHGYAPYSAYGSKPYPAYGKYPHPTYGGHAYPKYSGQAHPKYGSQAYPSTGPHDASPHEGHYRLAGTSYPSYASRQWAASQESPQCAEAIDGPVSSAYVTLVGTNEYGASRLIYLSKIQNVSLTLDAFELETAWTRFRFQTGRTLPEVVHINDGCRT